MRKILSLILGLLWTLPAFAALPTGYTELEYIESTRTQYIDTGVGLNAANKITGKISFVTLNNLAYIAGGRLSNNVAIGYALYAASHSGFTIYNTSWPEQGVDVSANQILEFETVMKSGQQSFIVNGNTIVTGDRTISLDSNNIYLFGLKTEYMAAAKVYSLKIYDNDTLVRNFIPAKNASGVIGMYDTVGNRFYTNAGTGEFIAGDPVTTCDGTVVNYTSATGTVSQSGTPTPTNPIEPVFYTQGDMVLRKVNSLADSYDASTGKITRRIGVKVFNGSESCRRFSDSLNVIVCGGIIDSNGSSSGLSNAFSRGHTGTASLLPGEFFPGNTNSKQHIYFNYGEWTDTKLAEFKQYLTDQYNAGTPVVVYYQLDEEVEEDWTETSYCETPIKIATTKYNETKFSPLNTALANAISVVDTVVSNTITQAASIATLQAQKQTRPNDIADDNEKCPAGKKCLLVEDASGVPHWYEIVTGRLPDGYTELEYIESTGTQWIDPDINITSTNIAAFKSEAVISNVTREGGSISGYSSPSSKLWYGLTSTSPYEFYYSDGHQEKSLNIVSEFRYYKYVIDAPNGSYSVYTESDEAVASKTGLNFSTSNDFKFYLFTYSPTGTASAFKPQKIKYAKFWFDGALVRNLVPALNPDGKIGMYDLVGGRFYENAGTGTFIGGQPVFN